MAVEDVDCHADSCYNLFHPVDVKVLDLYKNNVIYFSRSLSCLLQTIEVSSSPEGQQIGSIREELTWWDQSYKIENRNGETVLRILGPNWLSVCGSNVKFKVNFERIELDWIGSVIQLMDLVFFCILVDR